MVAGFAFSILSAWGHRVCKCLTFYFEEKNGISCEWYTKYTAYVSKYKFQFLRLYAYILFQTIFFSCRGAIFLGKLWFHAGEYYTQQASEIFISSNEYKSNFMDPHNGSNEMKKGYKPTCTASCSQAVYKLCTAL